MCSTLVASTRMATPMSRPGIMIGRVMKTRTPPRFLMLARTSGNAAVVPMTVESTVTQSATNKDFSSASENHGVVRTACRTSRW